ncbi:MAG: hypothetical protein DWQ02_00165 [Bacteroidetes bacterium]|nr:MAG: hypothetical protein DWQ02_00165 [Bacteroidota bacterium]
MNFKRILIVGLLLISTALLFAQDDDGILTGNVSFLTSKNIYVKFKNTDLIEVGDTLHITEGAMLKPCLLVTQKSSTSCVCVSLEGCQVAKEDLVVFKNQSSPEPEPVATQDQESEEINLETAPPPEELAEVKPLYQGRMRGRVSAASYSSLPADGDNRHRTMYRASFNGDHINNSRFSVQAYLNYRQNFISPQDDFGQQTKFFRVYNLAVKYDIDTTLALTLGRKINNKTSSLGAIDGLQGEKYFGKTYIGAIAGFRPDIFDFGFNFDLLQYGGYIGRQTNSKKFYSQTTLGLLEQRNKGQIDRRYTYFQHSSTLGRNLNLFASFELDLYKKIQDVITADPRLTNFYVSARYRLGRRVNFTVSYDSRKRIVFYETLKTDVEQLLDDDIARQGVRFRVNGRPFKYINVGASYSKRFQSDQQNKSDNINGYLSISKIPVIDGRFSVNFNWNTSNYLDSKILSFRHTRSMFKNKLSADLYFRMVNYTYLTSELKFNQQYYGANLSFRITRKLSLSILGELNTRDSENNFRVNTKIIKRFDNRK